MYKVITFVPENLLDIIIDEMAKAGAGNMGNYSHTCWITKGEGNWFPLDGAKPLIGTVGKMSRESEFKIEMICPEKNLNAVIDAIRNNHSYESPEIDVFKIDLYTK